MLSRFRIVLVEPTGPANVGAVCRAMTNLGLSDLVLVAPRCDLNHEDAVGFATRGRPLLEAARIVDSIPAALSDCVASFATTSRLGLYRRQAAVTPMEAAHRAVEAAAGGVVAFAFGRESWGFRTNELLHFDRVVTIPADADYPVLNLAAAVTIMCHELRQAALRAADEPLLPTALPRTVATDQKKQVMYEHLFDALDQLGFFSAQSPEKLRFALRHLFGRVDMSVNEADILTGMAQQIRWYIKHHPQRIDPPGAE
ncbi:MAG: hypothetical protein KKB50_16005 [Planctomycetes bacterium]|nr:hypothetical protein [Planctomycetota bacterium]